MLRYAITAILGLVVLVGLILAVRPLIFTFAPARGDGNYAVAASGQLGAVPLERTILLNEPHGLLGEQPNGRRATVRIVVSKPAVAGGVVVVNAWSPTAGCPVAVAVDRLRDCDGATWTYDGIPIDAERPLQRFPAQIRSGAVIVDFTRPFEAGAAP